MDNYKILGLEQNCTKEEIRAAYLKLAQKHHPDKGGDVKEFIKVKDAYEWLRKYHVKTVESENQASGWIVYEWVIIN